MISKSQNPKIWSTLSLTRSNFGRIFSIWNQLNFLRMIFLANLVIYFCFTTAHTHNLLHTRSTPQPHRKLTTTTLTHKSQDIYFVQGQENTKTRKPLICLQKLINSSLMKLKSQTRLRLRQCDFLRFISLEFRAIFSEWFACLRCFWFISIHSWYNLAIAFVSQK